MQLPHIVPFRVRREAQCSWDVLPSWKTWSRWNTDQEGEDLVRRSVFTDLHDLCTTQPLSYAQSWAIAMLIVWEFRRTVRVYMEKSGKRALQSSGKKLPHPVSCAWSIVRKDTRSGSRGIQLMISEVWEQQTVEWVSTDDLQGLVIWYASLSSYKALRLSSYNMVQQK